MDSDELERTFEAALAGDRVARNRLVDQLTPVIQKRVARVLLRSGATRGRAIRQDVEDLVQDVFVHLISKDYKVLRDWKRERGLSLQNFVGMVAERQTMCTLRSRNKNPYTEEPTPTEEFDDPDDDPDPEAVATSRDFLRKLLDRLKEEVSELGYYIFKLLYMCGLSPAETAKKSGISLDAVYQWQRRLRETARRLRDELSNSARPPQKPKERRTTDDSDELLKELSHVARDEPTTTEVSDDVDDDPGPESDRPRQGPERKANDGRF